MSAHNLNLAKGLFWLRVLAILAWFFGLLQAAHGMPVALLVPTLIAVPVVWFWRRTDIRYAFAAMVMLAVSGLVIAFSFSAYSFFGIAMLLGGLYWLLYGNGMGVAKLLTALFETPGAARAGEATKPQNPQGPVAAPKPAYSYAQHIKPARYTYASLVGMDETKQRLRLAADAIMAGEAQARNGILLFGKPGNGKTVFAEALAGELQVPFFSIDFGKIGSMWVGEKEQKAKAAFDAARQMGRGVFFIDEIDSLLKERDRSGHGSEFGRDLTNVLLTEIVELRGTKIVLIAATNDIDALDGAGIREKRFDFKVEIPPPDLAARTAILTHSIAGALSAQAADAAAIASMAGRWAGFSAARLSSLGQQLAETRQLQCIPFEAPVTLGEGVEALRVMRGRAGALPENVKAIDDIIMPAASRDTLTTLAWRMTHVDELEKFNGRVPTGLLFYGPPGTGKTQASMALAKASRYAFLATTGAQIMARPGSWDELVAKASDLRPAIVFIDEADDILRDRRQSNVGTLTNKVLTALDGSGGRVPDVIYIAATNHVDLLDEAVTRGGRFETKIRFAVPDRADMDAYIGRALQRHERAGYVFLPEATLQLSARLAGRSIADADAVIQALIDDAATRRIREQVNEVGADAVDCAADLVLDVAADV